MPYLSLEPQIVTLQPKPFLYLERLGPFEKSAPLAWEDFVWRTHGRYDERDIEASVSVSWTDREKEGEAAFIYQAGMLFKTWPQEVPEGLYLRILEAGKYARFCLKGSHAHLKGIYPRVFSTLARTGLNIRDRFCVEKYLNAAAITPEEDLRTEILIPVY